MAERRKKPIISRVGHSVVSVLYSGGGRRHTGQPRQYNYSFGVGLEISKSVAKSACGSQFVTGALRNIPKRYTIGNADK